MTPEQKKARETLLAFVLHLDILLGILTAPVESVF